MAKNKIIYNGNTLIDLTGDTVTADKLLQGYTAHDRSGALIIGTATQGGSVTQDQDGFIVLPPDGGGSGGASSYRLISSTECEVEDGITYSNRDIVSINCTLSDIWTGSKILYVQIRDKAGPRNGHFYGSDTLIYNVYAANSDARATYSTGARVTIRKKSDGTWDSTVSGGTTGYGVFAYSVNQLSSIVGIRGNYNATYSLDMVGTYTVKIYNLDWPDNISPFI